MLYRSEDRWQEAVLFPVEQNKVFVETDRGPRPSGRYKAIVNGHTGAMIAIVGRTYRVLRNSVALELALKGCTGVFPNTDSRSWEVNGVEVARSGGHCAIDLIHRRPGELGDFDWRIGPLTETYQPFLRVRNGYNGRTPFSLSFGFIRLKCGNGWLGGRVMRIAKVSHDARHIEEAVTRAIEKVDFPNLVRNLQDALNGIHKQWFPREWFPLVARFALRIRAPHRASGRSLHDWLALEQRIEEKCASYNDELGDTAYALWNAISDLATSPPVGYPLIPRSRHSLQQLASQWFSDFSNSIRSPAFTLDAYIDGIREGMPHNGKTAIPAGGDESLC